jgi:hypothetical protein
VIRDAAYAGISKELRSQWHEAHAAWLETLPDDAAPDRTELAAHHYRQAVTFRRDIGWLDVHTDSVSEKAGRLYLCAANEKAGRGEVVAATTFFARVAELLPPDDRGAILAQVDRATWSSALGDTSSGLEIARAAAATAASIDSDALNELTQLTRATLESEAGLLTEDSDEEAIVGAAYAAIERVDDPEAVARIWSIVASWETLHFLRCRRGQVAATQAHRLARTLGLPGVRMAAGAILIAATMRGPGRISRLIRDGEEHASNLGRSARANFLIERATLRAQGGDPEAMRRDVDEARQVLRELNFPEAPFDNLIGLAVLDSGASDEAVDLLRAALTWSLEAGDVGVAATVAGSLGRALALSGDYPAALAESTRSRDLASPADIASHVEWRGARIRALAADRTAEHDELIQIAEELLAFAASIEYPQTEFNARLDAAEGYRAAGQRQEAQRALQTAIHESRAREAHAFERRAREALSCL